MRTLVSDNTSSSNGARCSSHTQRPTLRRTQRSRNLRKAAFSLISSTSASAAQADPEADSAALLARYPRTVVADFDGNPEVTELDALIAYLQVLGTLVDFTTYRPTTASQAQPTTTATAAAQ